MNKWIFDGEVRTTEQKATIHWEDDDFFTLFYNGKTFFGHILSDDSENSQLTIQINHRIFSIRKQNPLDELIASLGMNAPKIKQLKELRAPMPGRIVEILVQIGQQIELGDDILSLEAMKMENVLKADGIGKVKKILVEPNQIVEKGQIIIEFE